MTAWPEVSFLEAAIDVSGGNIKTPQSQYRDEGAIAVVDQGKALIGGYTNDLSSQCKAELPVVIFGDHTRVLKFVDFPFSMGADGVKVLRPRDGLDAKFFYHFLRFVDIPSAGYDRHFKYLKRLNIPLPPLPEQRRIAAILDHADTLRAKRREALARLDELIQSIFVDMFGDLSTNPHRWETCQFGELIAAGPQNGLYKPAHLYGSGTRILRIDGFHNAVSIVERSLKRVRIEGNEIAKYALTPGDIVINRVNSIEHLGKSTLVPNLEETVVFESNMMRARLFDDRLNPVFGLAQLQSPFVRSQILVAAKDAVNQSSINQTDVRSLCVRVPPIGLQADYASLVARIGLLQTQHRVAVVHLEALFASLQSRAFRGEL